MPFSPLSSMMTNKGMSSFMENSIKSPTGFYVTGPDDDEGHKIPISFWERSDIQKQPKKRDDLQKRLAAFYQSVRHSKDYL